MVFHMVLLTVHILRINFGKKVHSKKLNIITLMKILIYILNLTLGLQNFCPKDEI